MDQGKLHSDLDELYGSSVQSDPKVTNRNPAWDVGIDRFEPVQADIDDGLSSSENTNTGLSEESAKAMAYDLTMTTGIPHKVVPVGTGWAISAQSANQPLVGDGESIQKEERTNARKEGRGTENRKRRSEGKSKADRLAELLLLPEEHRNNPKLKHLNQEQFQIKECYRSQSPVLILAAIGLSWMILPNGVLWFFEAFNPEMMKNLSKFMTQITMMKGVSIFGLCFVLMGVWKVVKMRLVTRFCFSSTYIKAEHGFIARKKSQVQYADIRDYELQQTALGRILNFGTIEVATAGTVGSEVVLSNVAHPELLLQILERRSKRARIVGDRFADNE